MTDQSLRPSSEPIDVVATLRSLGRRARASVQGEGRRWLLEVCVIMAVIVALSVALQPRIMLLQASPNPFWLPVVAAALVHGTIPGLATAILAGICAWVFGGGIATTEEDFYDLMFRAFKEPVLWLFAAILLGTFRDRIEEERQDLARERDEARSDLAEVVEHATALRRRIDDLERSIVLADLNESAGSSSSLPVARGRVARRAGGSLQAPSRPSSPIALPMARPDGAAAADRECATSPNVSLPPGKCPFGWHWACLWEATERGWEMTASEGDDALPDAGRLLRHFDQQPRVYDSRRPDDRQIMPSGAILVSPVRTGLGPPTTLIIVGGEALDEDTSLEELLGSVLRLAEKLSLTAERPS